MTTEGAPYCPVHVCCGGCSAAADAVDPRYKDTLPITMDEAAAVAYVRISRAEVARTNEAWPNRVMIDYDVNGWPVGIELHLAPVDPLRAGPGEASPLAALLANYLMVRQHTLSTAHLTGMEQMLAEAKYVVGEAHELLEAVQEMADAHERGEATSDHLTAIRKEVADVALADTTFAGLMPGGVTVELCIAEKTEADRGRG